ncbi:Nitrilase-like protein [Zancudomyces culisetae]|uniref:Nitrilase-like protein n=1 Tax=Zancudomyces culisetae TaxID=1213189 RepID=A0A1R1PVX5_ZANCU|nr:Nitrilase-like protein [Zancudomyces culisetae]|eukprot:OMH85115.1 Nitrilase-like protein [Zancudomyces culisetae]
MTLNSYKRVLASVGQFCANNDIQKNCSICVDLIKRAASIGSQILFLPEASDYLPVNPAEGMRLAQRLDGEFVTKIREAVKENNIWLSIGVHELDATVPTTSQGNPNEGGGEAEAEKSEGVRAYNSNILINNEGQIVSVYRKLHLFDVEIPNGPRIFESDSMKPGSKIIKPTTETPVGSLGLAICYDLRFGELAQTLRDMGATAIAFPAAFTEKTGAAHWEILVRARAIETQCFVFAAAQIGKHNQGAAQNHTRSGHTPAGSFGNAMIVDPWGTVLAKCSDFTTEPSLATAEIDMQRLEKIRTQMPVAKHRRRDIFSFVSFKE